MFSYAAFVFTNKDGFTDDDVAVRKAVKEGKGPDYDHLVMNVREAYRAGHAQYRVSYGPKEGVNERTAITNWLKTSFPTSHVHCEINKRFTRHLLIIVTFPQT